MPEVAWRGGMRLAAVLVYAIALSGCAQFQEQQQQQAFARQQAISANDDAKCQSFGAQPGTATYTQCRMSLDSQRTQIQHQAAQAYLNRAFPPRQSHTVTVCRPTPGQVDTCSYR